MNKEKILIMLDMGHGSSTPGKSSPVFDDGKKQLERISNVD